MWARVVEFMIALWLIFSPFIFRHPVEETFLWTNDFVCGVLVALFALFSFWHPLRKLHLLTLGVAFWLWGVGYTDFPDRATFAAQNSVVVGIILFTLAIIPCQAEQSPHSWKKFLDKKR